MFDHPGTNHFSFLLVNRQGSICPSLIKTTASHQVSRHCGAYVRCRIYHASLQDFAASVRLLVLLLMFCLASDDVCSLIILCILYASFISLAEALSPPTNFDLHISLFLCMQAVV
jgi:hypothetical protein